MLCFFYLSTSLSIFIAMPCWSRICVWPDVCFQTLVSWCSSSSSLFSRGFSPLRFGNERNERKITVKNERLSDLNKHLGYRISNYGWDDKLWDTRRWQVPEYQSSNRWGPFCFSSLSIRALCHKVSLPDLSSPLIHCWRDYRRMNSCSFSFVSNLWDGIDHRYWIYSRDLVYHWWPVDAGVFGVLETSGSTLIASCGSFFPMVCDPIFCWTKARESKQRPQFLVQHWKAFRLLHCPSRLSASSFSTTALGVRAK